MLNYRLLRDSTLDIARDNIQASSESGASTRAAATALQKQLKEKKPDTYRRIEAELWLEWRDEASREACLRSIRK